VVVEAASESGSLSTARAAGSRGAGRVLAVPGAPWDPGAAGCNDLIRDGATLVRSLDDVLEAIGAVTATPLAQPGAARPPPPPPRPTPAAVAGHAGPGPPPSLGQPRGATGRLSPPGRAWPPDASAAARTVLQVLADGQVLGFAGLAAATGLAPPAVASALLELELAGFVRRSAAGAEALAVPRGPPA